MSDAATVYTLAMTLPESDRIELAQKLIYSVEKESPPVTSSSTLAQEIADRQKRVERGEYDAFEWRESIDKIRQSLAEERNA